MAILVQGYAQLNNHILSQTFIGVLGHPAGARCTVGGPGEGPGGGPSRGDKLYISRDSSGGGGQVV